MNPPFCPNPKCLYHKSNEKDYLGHWQHYGFYSTLVTGKVKRFKCMQCNKGYSERTFSIHYYTKKSLDLKEIQRAMSRKESLSSVARKLNCSSDSVQNRISRMRKSAIATIFF